MVSLGEKRKERKKTQGHIVGPKLTAFTVHTEICVIKT